LLLATDFRGISAGIQVCPLKPRSSMSFQASLSTGSREVLRVGARHAPHFSHVP
jgi:hypothetical protein